MIMLVSKTGQTTKKKKKEKKEFGFTFFPCSNYFVMSYNVNFEFHISFIPELFTYYFL